MNLWGFIKGILVQDETDRTKEVAVEIDSGATTGTRTTIKAAQTADRTINIPDADDTLVGKETTDLLKNKQLEDDSLEIVDAGDNTKKIVLDASGTTGTKTTIQSSQTGDQVITLPDATDTLAGKQTTDVFENKTIDGTDATGNNTVSADADDITYDNSTSGLTATDMQAATDEVESRVDTVETGLSDHLADATDAHDASAISYDNSTSGMSATDVQEATDELEGRVDVLETFGAGKADTDLNNLAATAINQPLNFDAAVAGQLATADNGAGDSEDLTLKTGTATGTRGNVILDGNEIQPKANILPNDGGIDIGSGTNRVSQGWINSISAQNVILRDASLNLKGRLQHSQTLPSTNEAGISIVDAGESNRSVALHTLSDNTADANPTNDIRLETGNKTAGTGDSGNIHAITGSSSGGDRGEFYLNEKSLDSASVGHVWTLDDAVTGRGSWQLPTGAGGANTTLSNLTSPTSVNEDLIPTGVNNQELGSAAKRWNNIHFTAITGYASTGLNIVDHYYSGTTYHIEGQNGADFEYHTNDNPSGISSGDITIRSGDHNANNTGNLIIKSGNSPGNTSGDITIETGTGSTRGEIKFKDGSEGTAGHIIKSSSTDGEMVWGLPHGNDYLSVAITTEDNVTSNDTWVNTTEGSLALSAGRWEVGYSLAFLFLNSSGGATNMALATQLIKTSDSGRIPGSAAQMTKISFPDGQGMDHDITRICDITLATSDTIKLQFRGHEGAGGASVSVGPASTSLLTNPDGDAIMWARRITD